MYNIVYTIGVLYTRLYDENDCYFRNYHYIIRLFFVTVREFGSDFFTMSDWMINVIILRKRHLDKTR